MNSPAPSSLGNAGSRARLAVLAVFAAAAAYIGLKPLREPDLFWHLALGKAVWLEQARVVADPITVAGFKPFNTAVQWLWEVLAYLGWTQAGWPFISVLTAVTGAGIAVGIWLLVTRAVPAASLGVHALASAMTFGVVAARLRERPETLSLLILPFFALLSLRFADEAERRRRLVLAAALLALEIVWAQVHPLFILALPVFAVAALPALRARGRRLETLGLGALLLLGALTSADGLHIVETLRQNATGNVAEFVVEARDMTWERFNPGVYLYGPLYLGLVLFGVYGIAAARRAEWRFLALAAAGAAVASTAARGLIPAAILAAPLAAWGLAAFAAWVPMRFRAAASAALLVSAGLVVLETGRRIDASRGPLGVAGLAAEELPLAAAGFLRSAAPGTPVFTTFEAGPAVAFMLDGRVKTYVDGRTPLVFDATDFAVARAAAAGKTAFDLVQKRYGFEAAVVARQEPVCAALAADPAWAPVVSEAKFTTFVPASHSAPRLRFVSLCGPAAVKADACQSLEAARAEASRIEAAAGGFGAFLRLAIERRCNPGASPAELLAALPAPETAREFERERDLLHADLAFATGDIQTGTRLVLPYVYRSTKADMGLLLDAAERTGRWADFHPALKQAYENMADASPPALNLALAKACRAVGDVECVRYHALRAGALGKPVGELLTWVEGKLSNERLRDDVRGWKATFDRRAAAGGVTEAAAPAPAPEAPRGAGEQDDR